MEAGRLARGLQQFPRMERDSRGRVHRPWGLPGQGRQEVLCPVPAAGGDGKCGNPGPAPGVGMLRGKGPGPASRFPWPSRDTPGIPGPETPCRGGPAWIFPRPQGRELTGAPLPPPSLWPEWWPREWVPKGRPEGKLSGHGAPRALGSLAAGCEQLPLQLELYPTPGLPADGHCTPAPPLPAQPLPEHLSASSACSLPSLIKLGFWENMI